MRLVMSEPTSAKLGKYKLVARLATGGMAEIYLARQLVAGDFSRLVVVKRILPHLAEEERFIEMFLEEARLASQIQHPNVVQIFDVDQQSSSYYIAMEYIDGLSLGAISRRARKRGVLPGWLVSAEVITQACEGLHAAHELRDEAGELLGLVHRDISPHNLMIDKSGVVKLVDFGIAKAKTTSIRTRTGDVKGKYPYMSPEQVRAEPLDRRTDIFSLGAILAELLTGSRFFERGSELATLKAITEEPIPAIRELAPDIPVHLSDVVARSLQRARDDRFQTAEEMAVALRRVVESEGLRSSKRTIADYLERECQDLVEARARAVREVGKLPSLPVSSVPRVEGFDESTSTIGERVGDDDLTRPMGKPPQMKATVDGDQQTTESAGEAKPKSSRQVLWILAASVVALFGLAFFLGAVFFTDTFGPSGPPLIYAHPPTYSAETVTKGFAPLEEYLERTLDRPVDVRTTKTYAELKTKLISGELHIGNLSPLLYVQARHLDTGILPLVSHTYEGARTYQSYIITRTDSPITTVEQLAGKRFCFVDSGSTSGYLLPRLYLREKGIDPEEALASTRLSGTHTKVMQDVISGECDAGAVYSGAFSSASDLGVASSRLRLITVAGSTPWDVVCASPKLPRAQAKAIKEALLAFDVERDLGRKIVSSIFRIDGFLEPRLEDFEPLEKAARVEGLLDE